MVLGSFVTLMFSLYFMSKKMVEALSTGFQNLYDTFTRSINTEGIRQNGLRETYIVPKSTINTGETIPQRYRQKVRRIFVFDTKQVCHAKESKWPILKERKLRPFVGQCCPVCIPFTANGHIKVESNLKNLLDIYSIGLFKKSLFGSHIDAIKFFYMLKKQKYKYVSNDILNDEVVKNVITVVSREKFADTSEGDVSDLSKELQIQEIKAKNILKVMASRISNVIYKVVSCVAFYLFSWTTSSLVVQPSQIEKVKEAEQSGLPIIYLPLHKSHLDYILLGLVLTMYNIKPPLVAAGDNLRFFFFSNLLSRLGAFYIKRQMQSNNNEKDKLYWSILSSYIKNNLKSGHHIEFFLEGGRTRSGKCCVPKGGLLSIIVDAYREGVIEDAWIVPISMNYDRLFEGDFVREQLGQPKKSETFFATLLTFIRSICSPHGIMRVDFNAPYKLRDLYESIDKKLKLENIEGAGSLDLVENNKYKQIVDAMARHIIYDCWKSTATMSTNAISFLLLKKYRNGTTVEQLAKDLSKLRDKLKSSNRDIGFSGSSKDVVQHAVSILGPKLVICEKKNSELVIKPVLEVNSLIELSYYGNSLLSYYCHQSLVAIVLSYMVGSEFWSLNVSEVLVSRQILLEWIVWITELLKYDFVFLKPCQNIEDVLDSIIQIFEVEEIITKEQLLDEERQGQKMAKYFDSDSEDDYIRPVIDINYHVKADQNSLNKLKFFRSIMMPFLECMAECAYSFIASPYETVRENDQIQTILTQMQDNFAGGYLIYGESISVETIKHSFLSFEQLGCLSIQKIDNIKMLSMIDESRTNMEKVLSYLELFVEPTA
ncbi:glycerol-3-phosphate acyltransferase 1, mitochondrial [Adelges cooleyi]|uniref:glycerol-3-phosphate acyltransferase 1, mitochondrial n=1 Tax=Adelges cooleyi TaxID=133065 RepID=UPI0021807583|nr:glycerol-3-phosphate acyltransferase 1, mitochondrial [Adelges cooleyi]